MKINKTHFRPPVSSRYQEGVSLVVTIVVLLAITSLALAATNTNQSQALMVRNAQLRLEAFNSSFAEIDSQIDTINSLDLNDGPPEYVLAMIDSPVGTIVDANTPVRLPAYSFSISDDDDTDDEGIKIAQSVSQEYVGKCRVPGQQEGAGFEKVQCSQLLIDSTSTVIGTSVDSPQNQIYQYQTLKES